MCGICGMIGNGLTDEEKELFFELLLLNETRGRDATGIWYGFESERLVKLPVRATYFVGELKDLLLADMRDVSMILGHTRAATRGSPEINRNNHPFRIGDYVFAHNGIAYDYKEFSWRYSYEELPNFADNEILTDSYRNLFVPIVEKLFQKGKVEVEDVKEAIEAVVNEKYVIGAFWLADLNKKRVYVVNIDGELTYDVSGVFLFSSIELKEVLEGGRMIVVSIDDELDVEEVKLYVPKRVRRKGGNKRVVRSGKYEDEWRWYGW